MFSSFPLATPPVLEITPGSCSGPTKILPLNLVSIIVGLPEFFFPRFHNSSSELIISLMIIKTIRSTHRNYNSITSYILYFIS
jgi:hypothetical protein